MTSARKTREHSVGDRSISIERARMPSLSSHELRVRHGEVSPPTRKRCYPSSIRSAGHISAESLLWTHHGFLPRLFAGERCSVSRATSGRFRGILQEKSRSSSSSLPQQTWGGRSTSAGQKFRHQVQIATGH